MPYNQNVQSIGLADEPNMGLPAPASDNHESSEMADDVLDSLCSESTWPQHIRINQKDRVVDSAVFHDSLLIRAGLIVVGVIALLGLAWIVRSSLSPSHLPSSSAVQIASSATIPDSKGDPIEPLGSGVREAFVEARAEAGSEHLSSSTSNRPKLSQGASALAGSSMIGHSSGSQRNTSSIRVNGKETDSGTRRTPVPETRPTTIEGWTVREVTNGIAALEGPNGILKVKRGDVVPGLGRIDSIVLWGQRWIVATRRGLISTP